MWPQVLEKAWAKVKGSYETSSGGYLATGIRALVGCPVFMYDDINNTDDYYNLMKEAEDVDYLVAISTLDEGYFSDQYGLLPGHQYTVLALFTLEETDGTENEMILMRNPWKESYYSGEWDHTDSRWTSSLIS